MNKIVNKSTTLRVIKDKEHPYVTLPHYYFKGEYDYIELAILSFLSSNSDKFNIVKSYVRTFLKIPKQKFESAWKSLENKGHLFGERKFGHWIWVYSEKSFKQGTLPKDGNCVKNTCNSGKDNTLPTDRFSTDRLSTDRQLLNNNKMSIKETDPSTLELKSNSDRFIASDETSSSSGSKPDLSKAQLQYRNNLDVNIDDILKANFITTSKDLDMDFNLEMTTDFPDDF